MVTPSEITGFVNNKWFTGLAGAGKWFLYVVISIVILVIFWLILRYLEHNKKVTYFPVYGGDPSKLKEFAKDGIITDEELKKLGIQIGHPKFAKIKDIKENGVRKCSLIISSEKATIFKPKKIKEIPFNMRYPDGIWMIRVGKEGFFPICRPDADSKIVLKIPEPDMDLWEEAMQAQIRMRTQDDDASKRAVMMTVVIIIGAFVLAGLIIWLSMSFAGKSINDVLVEVKPMTDALTKIAGDKLAPG